MRTLLFALMLMLAGCSASRQVSTSTSGGHYLFTHFEVSQNYVVFETVVYYQPEEELLVMDVQANKTPMQRYVLGYELGECYAADPGETKATAIDNCYVPIRIRSVLEHSSGLSLTPDSIQAYLRAINSWTQQKGDPAHEEATALEEIVDKR